VLVLHANGINRDREAALAFALAGGLPKVVHVNELVARPSMLSEYQMLVLPGGFSYGDDLGAGKIMSLDLRYRFRDALAEFHSRRKPMLGICNGFQALVKSGLLPGDGEEEPGQSVTLTRNLSARFECRWVLLRPNPASPCVFTRGLIDSVYCPVAHGEGRLVVNNETTLAGLQEAGQVALTYTLADGPPASGGYPANPNGSAADIAGLCDPTGTVLGLMPHPEDHLFAAQHPRAARGERGMLGLPLFQNGVRYASGV
jgi:phosphoribosylformylglycinamidine synthase subunit PurQ / glutaminase